MALDASRRLSDKLAQALSQRSLGCAFVQLSSYDNARVHLQDALQLFGELGDDTGQADARISLAWMMERQGQYREAVPHAQAALAIAQAVGHRSRQARALNAVGWFHAQLGDHEQALVYCHQALDLAREIGDAYDEANTYDSLGYAYRHLGRQSEATASTSTLPAFTETSVTSTTKLTPSSLWGTLTGDSAISSPRGSLGNGHWQFSTSSATPSPIRSEPKYVSRAYTRTRAQAYARYTH